MAGLLALAFVVTACTALSPEEGETPGSSPEVSADPSQGTEPVLVPDGTAEDNLPLFADVVGAVWLGPDNVAGRSYIDALVAAGFDKTVMEVTEDRSTVDRAAESIQFSVRWNEQCLIGQVGPTTGDPHTAIADVTPEGTCLIGNTRVIDW